MYVYPIVYYVPLSTMCSLASLVCVCRMKKIIFMLLVTLARSSGWNCLRASNVVEPERASGVVDSEGVDRVGHLRQGPDRAGRPGQYVIIPITTPTPARGMPFFRVPALFGSGSGVILYLLPATTPANSVLSDDGSDE